MHREGGSANENYHNLARNDYELNADEKEIAVNALEDVQFVIESPVVVLVKDLHPNKCVEDQGLQLVLLALRLVREQNRSGKIQNEGDYKLKNALSDDHLPHRQRNQRCSFGLWFAVKDAR